MKINAILLFHQINRYFHVTFSYYYGKNWVKTPMFYNRYFQMDEHIVLVSSKDLEECLNKVKHAAIICLDPPDQLPDTERIQTNDVIILDDPMSSRMAFNILTHILDRFIEWELNMNDILYHNRSFQDAIDTIGKLVGLPISLCDVHFRYIAFSKDSIIYVDQFVTEQNELPLEDIIRLQRNPEFHKLEQIKEAFVHTGIEKCVHKNIYNKEDVYVGRLSCIIRNDTDEEAFCKSVFDMAAPFLEALYDKYNSFTNLNLSYQQVHDYLYQIFNHKQTDRQGFYQLMKLLQNESSQDWSVVTLRYQEDSPRLLSSTYLCEQLERDFHGCYAISLKDHIVILLNVSRNQNPVSQKHVAHFVDNLKELKIVSGFSRIFHTLTTFEIMYFAYHQALYALEQGTFRDKTQVLHFFDDYALDYLLSYGSQKITYTQICHPALLLLSKYDKEHGTSYVETLNAYMDCNMNAVATAKKLYIHRSSFINRMERINQQVKLNLEDPRERLYLNMSFALYADLLLPVREET